MLPPVVNKFPIVFELNILARPVPIIKFLFILAPPKTVNEPPVPNPIVLFVLWIFTCLEIVAPPNTYKAPLLVPGTESVVLLIWIESII